MGRERERHNMKRESLKSKDGVRDGGNGERERESRDEQMKEKQEGEHKERD